MEIKNEELLEFFVKFHQEGQKFFKELANHISDPKANRFLLFMSEDEARHGIQFKKFLEEKGDRKYGWENDPNLRELIDKHLKQGLFPKLDEVFVSLPKNVGIREALDFALKCEDLLVELYDTLRSHCIDFETTGLIIELESEEKANRAYIQNFIEDLKKESS